jgi:hypothetical protein
MADKGKKDRIVATTPEQEEIKARIERELKQGDTIPLERCDLLKEKGAR